MRDRGAKHLAMEFAAKWADRTGAIAAWFEGHIYSVAMGWALLICAIALLGIILGHDALDADALRLDIILYLVLAFAPTMAVRLADLSFPRDRSPRAPSAQSRRGRWLHLDEDAARAHPAFGTTGLVAALALGLLMNIGFRCGEFLMAMPPAALMGPPWARILFSAMMLDAIVFSLLYAFAFMLAVRHARAFPRLLVVIWACDLASQLMIARALGAAPIPAHVAASLVALLTGNLKKTLLSVTIWLPYLLVSPRVNVTFRHRIPRAMWSLTNEEFRG